MHTIKSSDQSLQSKVKEFLQLKAELDALESKVESIKDEIKAQYKDFDYSILPADDSTFMVLTNLGDELRFTKQVGSRFLTDKFKEEHPKLHAQYLSPTSFIKLSIKAAKKK